MNLPTGEIVIINAYEKLRKRCFYCLRLAHEKALCPLLRKKSFGPKISYHPQEKSQSNYQRVLLDGKGKANQKLEGPLGFPPLFHELSKQDQHMSL